MDKNIYQLLQAAIPALQTQVVPAQQGDLYQLYVWINQTHSFMHYIELKAFADNGIEYNYYFKSFAVDHSLVQNEILTTIETVFADLDQSSLEIGDDFNAYIEARISMDEQVEEIIFDHIQKYAAQHQLKLLVIVRENPYWMLLPSQNQDLIDQIVTTFNQHFCADGDLLMLEYSL